MNSWNSSNWMGSSTVWVRRNWMGSSVHCVVFPLYTSLWINKSKKSFDLNNPLLSFAIPVLVPLQMHCVFCFVTSLDYLHCIGDFSLFMWNFLTTQELWSLEHKDEKLSVSYVKVWTKNGFCFQEWKIRYDATSEHRDGNIF